MKTFDMNYFINGTKYQRFVMAKNYRTAKFKLSVKHRCDVNTIKVVEYREM